MKKFSFIIAILIAMGTIANANSWSSWENISCYKGIDIRFKKSSHENRWFYEIRNQYSKKIHLNYKPVEYSKRNETIKTLDRISIASGEKYKNDTYSIPKSSNIWIHVNKVRFSSLDYGKYSQCDK